MHGHAEGATSEAHLRSHSHAHDHAHAHLSSRHLTGILGVAVVATLALVVVEFAAGYIGHSIALVGDAVHNLTDVPALVISWLAARWAERPPTREHTYGYHRAGILAAFTNALGLGAVAVFVLYESWMRLRHPVAVQADVMLWVSLLALAVNGGITLALVAGRRDLNIRAILLHSAGDAVSSVAVLAGALAIRWTGARWVDPAIGLAIGALVLWSGWGILRESSHILLEGLPRHLRLEDVAHKILAVSGVQEVHDIHIWTLGTDWNALSCHIQVPDMHLEECERILGEIQAVLERQFRISHSTIQFERAGLPAESGYYMPQPLGAPRKR